MDDSSYLSGVITEIEGRYDVDPKRVFFVGHSNGAFMAYRMACDHADQIAAIVSFEGAMWSDPTKCTPSDAVSVAEIHGTADTTIDYDGGSIPQVEPSLREVTYPGATTTVSDWVTFDGCASTADTSSPPLDIVTNAQTTVTRYASGCREGSDAELWTVPGGTHTPTLGTSFGSDVIDFLFAHPKP